MEEVVHPARVGGFRGRSGGGVVVGGRSGLSQVRGRVEREDGAGVGGPGSVGVEEGTGILGCDCFLFFGSNYFRQLVTKATGPVLDQREKKEAYFGQTTGTELVDFIWDRFGPWHGRAEDNAETDEHRSEGLG